jgi:hypothetical protein
MRHLQEDAGAVAGVGLAAARAAMVEVEQGLHRLLNDRMGPPAFDVDHEPYPARLVFEPRVVKALPGRETGPLRLTSIARVGCSVRHSPEKRLSGLAVAKVY